MWEKVLYKKQGFLDNYVEHKYFLRELKRNSFTPIYTSSQLVRASELIVRPYTLVCLFMCLYYYLKEEWISPLALFSTSTTFFITNALLSPQDVPYFFFQPSLFFHAFLCGVAPILCTLTQSISTDTLWAMTVFMFLFHLLFYNYKKRQALYYNAISLNAAVFAAVCLASMMSTALEGFVVVSMAVQVFGFAPLFNRYFTFITSLLVIITTTLLWKISFTSTVFFLAGVLSLLILFPIWLHSLQSSKNNIYGPWDEAIII